MAISIEKIGFLPSAHSFQARRTGRFRPPGSLDSMVIGGVH
jgi:hypothetical protein